MTKHFTAGEGSLWAQIDGPNTPMQYLGCHLLGDVDEPLGDVTLIYCKDPSGPSRYRVVGSYQGEAGAPTTTVTTDVTDELDYLERAKCVFPLYVAMIPRGRADEFTNADRVFVFTNARVTNRGLSGLTSREPEDEARSDQTFDLSGEKLIRYVPPRLNRSTIAETADIMDISLCSGEVCRTDEYPSVGAGQYGFAVTGAPTGSPSGTAQVLVTVNGGSWNATAADPFAAAEAISAVECFSMGRDDYRVVVARGTTAAADPMEIAYSDDDGATWITVELGIANDGDFIVSGNGLFALDSNHIWAATNEGYVYFSEDGGTSWEELLAGGVVSSGPIRAIHFADQNVGWLGAENNIIARTVDGGVSWSLITGPAGQTTDDIFSVAALDRNRVWIGYNDGTLWFTLDGGLNWSQRAFHLSGTGEVSAIEMLDEYQGAMLHNNGSNVGRVFVTINGGYSWQAITTPTNLGLRSVKYASEHMFYVSGNTQGGLGYIAKAMAAGMS